MSRTHPNDRRSLLLLAAGLALAGAGVACAQQSRPAGERQAAPAQAAEASPAPARSAAANPAALLEPASLTEKAPERFEARFETTKGTFTVEVHRAWAPNGADRFYNLVKNGFYDDVAFFRVISGFMAQFGLSGEPAINAKWRDASIPDDPVSQSNTRGMVSFATRGPNTRTTQLFINFGNNARLDGMGFSPFAKVDEEGMKVVDALHAGYGEGAPRGRGPNQGLVQSQGNAYLRAQFPELDYLIDASIVE
jgi:peptidyl-prolyl cis-trans isomerase A (cyclophilin A)